LLDVRFSTTLDVDDSWDDDDGKKIAANAALVVKLNFHHDGGLSYGDEDDEDVAVANEVNILNNRNITNESLS
jgi:hypothetical protein